MLFPLYIIKGVRRNSCIFCKETRKLSVFSVKKSHKVSAVHDFFLPLHPLSGNPPVGDASPGEAVL